MYAPKGCRDVEHTRMRWNDRLSAHKIRVRAHPLGLNYGDDDSET